MSDVSLETDRLLLRQLRHSDLDPFAEMYASEELTRYLGDGKPIDRLEAWRKIALLLGHWELRGYGMFAVEKKSTGEFVGHVGLWNPECWPEFEVGWIIHPRHWGNGYATEAGGTAMDWAFEELGREKVGSVIRPGNERSVRVAQKLGETFERDDMIRDIPVMIYSISRDDWKNRRSAPQHRG